MIYADACREPQRKINNEIVGGVEDCSLEIVADRFVPSQRVVRFTNPAIVEVLLALSLDGDPSIRLGEVPETIDAGFSVDVAIQVQPVDDDVVGTLHVDTNAANTPEGDGHIEIAIAALGQVKSS